jgi:LysR family transcriptional regulator, glycine cleavage system transcriptional activator
MISSRIPVCSPELLKNGPPISQPEDLLKYPILREEESWDRWDQWFNFAGFEETPKLTGPRLENAYMAIKAAEAGLGIALGAKGLITEKIAPGRLVVLVELKTEPKCYYTINYAKNWKRQSKIVAFRGWLFSELESSAKLDSARDGLSKIAL